ARFLARRLGHAVVIVLLIVGINFTILHLAPGDAVDVLAGETGAASPQYLADLRQRFGLDQPLHVQFLKYVWNVAQLDLGMSHRNNKSVLSLILERLPATLLLMLGSIGLAFIAGIALGVAASRRVGSAADAVISVVALLAYATPLFWLGLMLVVLFTLKLGLLPSSGMYTIGASTTALGHALDVMRHMVLPVITLSMFYMATYTMLMRASMLEVSGMDFVRTARAKGLAPRRVAYRHVLPNAILPMVTMLGVQIGSMMGGAVVVEVVFGWPGLGRLAFNAIFERDHNLLLGLLFLCSVLVVLVNIAVDLLTAWLDPRIELDVRR
ncbi:MAG: ABC transporter permease, partial [Alphaproteobacteria bacterium]|nr:ABC transporter permease [Alphaproteobacteria bacterium]